MRFAGLFVGVDRQLDVRIEALNYAGRDAQVFWAAFADANEVEGEGEDADTTLLIGEDATTERVGNALASLVERTNRHFYDLAVVHVSCHGTEDGHLVMANTAADDVDATAVRVANLATALEKVRAGVVVVVFESCFSGVAVGRTPTGEDGGLRAVMGALTHNNRAVIWASGPKQRAWETPRLKHGVLTYSLVVEGLYGTYALQDGRISIRRWLDVAIDRAEKHARLDGVVQQPGNLIWLSGEPTLPSFRPGPRRERQLEEDRIREVGPDLAGLEEYALSTDTISAVRARIGGKPLTEMQRRAIYPEGVLAGRNLLVSGPTSCGKTLIGELAALATTARRLKTAVLLPTRALAAEKWREFDCAFGTGGLRAVRSFGGTADDDHLIAKGHFDVGFFTFEKFWLFALTNPKLLDALGLVIVDEVHMLADPNRGHVVELVLTFLRRRREQGKPIQTVALSAALGSLNDLPAWLDAQLVKEEQRPIPLLEGVIGPHGVHRRRDSRDKIESEVRILDRPVSVAVRGKDGTGAKARGNVAAALINTLLAKGEQVLVFRSSRWATRSLARDLASELRLPANSTTLAALGADTAGKDQSRASQELHDCLRAGVGFHISDLDRAEREAVEVAFRSGELRVLVATSGLAVGVNLPATTVVIGDHSYGSRRYTVSEYLNMAGRAGRWIDGITNGTSYLVAESESLAKKLWDALVLGTPESIDSQLAGLAHEDLLLVLLAMAQEPLTRYELLLLACDTFAGFRHRDDAEWRGRLDAGLALAAETLEASGFVSREGGRVSPTPYGFVCGREGLCVASARRVLDGAAVIVAGGEALKEIDLIGLAQMTDELDRLDTPVETTGTDEFLTEYNAWRVESQRTLGSRAALLAVLRSTAVGDDQYLRRLKRLNAISMWVRGKALADIEDTFTQYTAKWKDPEPAAGPIRQAAERTADVIRAVARLVAVRYPDSSGELGDMVTALIPRLEHGVGRDATALMRAGLGVRRGEALQLGAAGIATLAALTAAVVADDKRLYPIFGSEGVYRLRATIDGRQVRGRPSAIAEAREASQRSLFDQIGDAAAI
jgi:helicase